MNCVDIARQRAPRGRGRVACLLVDLKKWDGQAQTWKDGEFSGEWGSMLFQP